MLDYEQLEKLRETLDFEDIHRLMILAELQCAFEYEDEDEMPTKEQLRDYTEIIYRWWINGDSPIDAIHFANCFYQAWRNTENRRDMYQILAEAEDFYYN